jgi:hypothetical protein
VRAAFACERRNGLGRWYALIFILISLSFCHSAFILHILASLFVAFILHILASLFVAYLSPHPHITALPSDFRTPVVPTNQSRDCAFYWNAWGPCSVTCGGGVQHRTGIVTQQPLNGGQNCPFLSEIQACNTKGCPGAFDALFSLQSSNASCSA